MDFLERHRDYVITYHDAFMFNSKGIIQSPQLTGKLRKDATALELMQGRPISTLTVCFRNLIQELPPELLGVGSAGYLLVVAARRLQQGKFMAEISPAAYRVHEGGIFSMRSSKQRIHMAMHAHYCLARYYHRIGNNALYEYFLVRCSASASRWSRHSASSRHSRPSPRTSRSTCCAG